MLTRNPLYLLYGMLTIGWIGWSQYRGLGEGTYNQAKVPPKSIRDNPGSYRSHYGFYPRYTGGK